VSTGVADNEWTVETTSWPAVWLPRLGDERLARLAARGSDRAFAAMYERYHQQLYRYCRSILRNDADAQDALQSTFTRALSALKRDKRSAPVRPWLFRIAHNEAISVLRRRRGGDEQLDGAPLPTVASAEDQAGARARLELLMGDLATLPDRSRSALVMREMSGLSHEDIAVALDISTGAAKQAIFEARRGLLECAEGRAMPCDEVCRAVSDGDRRVLRGRRVRAHLRDCASCAAFAASIKTRERDLRAFAPALPVAASITLLSRATEGAVVAVSSKGFATASLLATAAVSVGGVAAVVRLDQVPRPAVAHHAHPAQVSPARHAHAGSAASNAGSARGAGSAAGGTNTIAAGRHARHSSSRHVRFVPSFGHKHHGGAHRTMPTGFGESGHGWQHSDGGEGVSRGRSVARHGTGPVPGVGHGSLEGYANGHGRGHSTAGSSSSGRGRSSSSRSHVRRSSSPSSHGLLSTPPGQARGHNK
jgi:RNA polymerase sigma factor (sigma-70 family)